MKATNELMIVDGVTALDVFSTSGGLDPLITEARDFVGSFDHDITTATGRKKTASLAAKVAKLKTTLDGMGKDLVADWKKQSKAVDDSRRMMREELDALKIEARRPLTEWEQEQERIQQEEEEAEAAKKLQEEIINSHEIAILYNEKFDRDLADKRAEEQRLINEQQEKQAREQAEREEKIRRDAEEKAIEEASKKAREDAERLEAEKQHAIQMAQQAEREKVAAEERAKLQADQAIKDRELAEKRAIEQEVQRQKEEERRVAADKEAREANKRHVGSIRKQAKESLMTLGMTEGLARRIVLAINAGEIKNVTINY